MSSPTTALTARQAGGPTAQGRTGARRDRAFLAASALLFVAAAAGTIVWCGSMPAGMPMPGGWTMSMAWMRMPGQSWSGAAASFVGMWLVMMVAMMMPSLVAMLRSYRMTLRGAGEPRVEVLTALAGGGYFVAWTAVGVLAYPLGMAPAAAAMHWPVLARAVPAATGAALVLAGCLQLSAWKVRRLDGCRNAPACCGPLAPGPIGAVRAGLRLGRQCALCCSGLMVVLLVGGVMDPGVMAAVAAAITLERLAPRAVLAARASGLVVVAVGIAVFANVLLRL